MREKYGLSRIVCPLCLKEIETADEISVRRYAHWNSPCAFVCQFIWVIEFQSSHIIYRILLCKRAESVYSSPIPSPPPIKLVVIISVFSSNRITSTSAFWKRNFENEQFSVILSHEVTEREQSISPWERCHEVTERVLLTLILKTPSPRISDFRKSSSQNSILSEGEVVKEARYD